MFHQFVRRPNGNWDIRPIERTGELWYLISESKEKSLQQSLPQRILRTSSCMMRSSLKHLSPFIAAAPAKGLIPLTEGAGSPETSIPDLSCTRKRQYGICFPADCRCGRTRSSSLPQRDDQYLRETPISRISLKTIWYFPVQVGSNPCAAYIDLRQFDRNRLVIDQTLYWYLSKTEDEAIYISGLLNSAALWEAISDFQPEGGFGKRSYPYASI